MNETDKTSDRETSVPWVNLSNDLMFHLVMQDAERCRKLLEMILEFPISKVEVTVQKDITPSLLDKGVRLDVYAEDEDHSRYNVEMQTTISAEIGQRLRYYQCRLDHDGLKRGERYGRLKKSYIIFICMDDPFHEGISRYTIEPRCLEADVAVRTGQQWILLNASGDGTGVTKEVQEFLTFAKNSIPENKSNPYLCDISEEMERIMAGEWRDIMITYEEKLEMMREDLREEGLRKGRAQGRAEGRAEGLEVGLMEGCEKGLLTKVISQVCKKLKKGYPSSEIAEMLEEEEPLIKKICDVASQFAPDYDTEKIYGKLTK